MILQKKWKITSIFPIDNSISTGIKRREKDDLNLSIMEFGNVTDQTLVIMKSLKNFIMFGLDILYCVPIYHQGMV